MRVDTNHLEGIKEIPPFCVLVRVDKYILSKIFLIKSLSLKSLKNLRLHYFKGLFELDFLMSMGR